MPRLVQPEFTAARQPDRRHEAEPLIADGPGDVDALGLQLSDGRVDVVAHEVELVPAGLVRGMGCQLSRRQSEDQPPVSGVGERQLEHVSEKRAILLRIRRENQCMDSRDHVRPSKALDAVLQIGHQDQYHSPIVTIGQALSPDPGAVSAAIARNVRSLRQGRGWTLSALAARSGVSKGMVVELEQGRTNPSVATVCRLATALGVGLVQLLEVGDEPELRVVGQGEAVRLWDGAEGGRGDFLVGSQHPAKTELWDWTLEPRDAYEGQIHPEGSHELLYVVEGEITLVLDRRQRVALPERAAALYTADRPHRIENSGAVPAHMIMVLVESGDS
jgi:transcriptional regulator with XRE-family HTH domain